jgi:hypothetical protein
LVLRDKRSFDLIPGHDRVVDDRRVRVSGCRVSRGFPIHIGLDDCALRDRGESKIHEFEASRLSEGGLYFVWIVHAGEFAHDAVISRHLKNAFVHAKGIGAVFKDEAGGFHLFLADGCAFGQVRFEHNLQAAAQVEAEFWADVAAP